ncbi:MAG: diacylglycerol kinase family protein [Crocinitomicaceae bacterium]
MKKFIQKEQRSFKVAFNGLKILLNETHFIAHLCFAALAILLGFLFKIDDIEWMLIALCIAMVLAAEATNTAIERITDYISLEKTPEAKIIKDIGAAMVLITAIGSLVVGILVFVF